MSSLWEVVAHIQSFFRLDFIFSGLEVSSNVLFAARVLTLVVIGGGVIYAVFQIPIKILDCIQAFASSLGNFPGSFFLVLLLVLPLSPDSLGAVWIGYILLALSLFGVAAVIAALIVLWKHGTDQLVRVIRTIKSGPDRAGPSTPESKSPPENGFDRDRMHRRSDSGNDTWPVDGDPEVSRPPR